MIPDLNSPNATLPLSELQTLKTNKTQIFELHQENALIAQIIFDIQEKGISILQNALPSTLVSQLREQFELGSMAENFLMPAGIGRNQQLHQNRFVRQDSIRWIESSSEVEVRWLDMIERLRMALNQQLYLGLSEFESHYAKYKAGEFYHRHVDAFSGKSNRKLSIILYLNENWQPADGGELVIETSSDTDTTHTTKVLPNAGTIVCFLSEEFPHQVLPPNKDRLSIAGWFSINPTKLF